MKAYFRPRTQALPGHTYEPRTPFYSFEQESNRLVVALKTLAVSAKAATKASVVESQATKLRIVWIGVESQVVGAEGHDVPERTMGMMFLKELWA